MRKIFSKPLSDKDLELMAHFELLRNGTIFSYTYNYTQDGVGYVGSRTHCGGLPAAFARLGEGFRAASEGFATALTEGFAPLQDRFAQIGASLVANGLAQADTIKAKGGQSGTEH